MMYLQNGFSEVKRDYEQFVSRKGQETISVHCLYCLPDPCEGDLM